MRVFGAMLVFCASALAAWPAAAQFKEGDPGGAKIGESRAMKWQVGFEVTALGGPCKAIAGFAPVPVAWPEQEVKIAAEDVSPGAHVAFQSLEDVPRMVMVVRIPQIQTNETIRGVVTFEVRRNVQLPPDKKERDAFVLPEGPQLSAVRRYLGTSPQIEAGDPGIRKTAKSIGADKEKAWERVEALYDWARKKVEYKHGGKCKGAVAAMRKGAGGHEDITSLFIALCRAAGVPARTVWVPEFCYAEFYLVDGKGEGHWIPCQPAGARAFGEMPDTKPILAKGDRFHPPYPSKDKQVRFLADGFSVAPLKGKAGAPQYKYIHQLVN